MISPGRVLAILLKEVRQLSRDRLTLGMAVGMPLIQLLIFGYAINTEVRNVPVAVVDASGSALVRDITAAVEASQVVTVTQAYPDPLAAERAMLRNTVRAVLLFPADADQRFAQGRPVAQWLVDGSDTMISSALMRLRQMPLDPIIGDPGGRVGPMAPTFEVALYYNPQRRSAINIVPGLTAIILTMTMVFFTSAAIVRERERGNLELLIATPIAPLELMLGKIMAYVVIGFVQVGIILGLGHLVFGVPFAGSLGNLVLVTFLFICACLSLGLLISTLAQNQLQTMQMTVLVMMPSILLSGFMFPFQSMPLPAQYLAEVLPATPYMRLIRAVVLKGAGIEVLYRDCLWLAGFTALFIGLASLRFRKTLD